MEKFCVFCGRRPEAKNREHIIPRWLIELTGDPKRSVYLGRDWTSPDLAERRFAFDAFTFPACGECNASFSVLEARARTVVERILACESISAPEWSIFLDWLDKVRTGLWLGLIYLNKNYRGIDPMFHIQQRVGLQDRLVIVYRLENDGRSGVGWAATDTPLFHCMPSCFMLCINTFLFLNASSDFLFSRRFGFPYPVKREVRPEGGYWAELGKGTARHTLPLVQVAFPTGGTQLCQPMVPWQGIRTAEDAMSDQTDLYDNEFVRTNCMDHPAGVGKIFMQKRDCLPPYPLERSRDWLPKRCLSRGKAFYRVGLAAGHYLEELYRNHPSFAPLTEHERNAYEAQVEGALKLHRTIMDHFRAQKRMYW